MVQDKPSSIQELNRIVNVASVSQRSPFRYPGGKTWLIPQIRTWLNSQLKRPRLLIEPFAGGGIVGLTVAFESLAVRVLMVELDEQVASVWKTLLSGDAEWLADRILKFEMTQESLAKVLNDDELSIRQNAFKTLLRNRTNHGGIMAPGAGLIKNGEHGKGINSRWYPYTLAKRIRNIGKLADKIEFIHGDGITVMSKYAMQSDVVYFIDPPYTAAGKKAGTRLYKHNALNHEELFELAETLQGEFLMTYNDAAGVR
ncbi:MAG: DNA adenine methylase, partial [Sedimentisphaerales bacterium]